MDSASFAVKLRAAWMASVTNLAALSAKKDITLQDSCALIAEMILRDVLFAQML